MLNVVGTPFGAGVRWFTPLGLPEPWSFLCRCLFARAAVSGCASWQRARRQFGDGGGAAGSKSATTRKSRASRPNLTERKLLKAKSMAEATTEDTMLFRGHYVVPRRQKKRKKKRSNAKLTARVETPQSMTSPGIMQHDTLPENRMGTTQHTE